MKACSACRSTFCYLYHNQPMDSLAAQRHIVHVCLSNVHTCSSTGQQRSRAVPRHIPALTEHIMHTSEADTAQEPYQTGESNSLITRNSVWGLIAPEEVLAVAETPGAGAGPAASVLSALTCCCTTCSCAGQAPPHRLAFPSSSARYS